MRCLDNITGLRGMSLSKLRDMVKDREAWHAAVYGVTKSRTWNNNNKRENLGIWGRGEGRGGEHPRGKDRSHHWLSICHMPGVLSGGFCLLLQP